MSVYVDPLFNTQPYYKSQNERWNWKQSCHLTADTLDELHTFAARLGLQRAWFQPKSHPHYDLTASKRAQAVRLGAVEITHQQAAERLVKARTRMNLEDMHKAYETDEVLEYHVMGGEIDPDNLLPEHGWYPCTVMGVWKNGNVEIDLTTPKFSVPLHVTVLRRNIPIAFRRIESEPPISHAEALRAIREETDEEEPTLAELINLGGER